MKILELFKKKESSIKEEVINLVKEEHIIETKEEVKIIDSKAIQEDIKVSFDKVLEEFNLDPSKETQVEELNCKLNQFKNINKDVYNRIDLLKNLGLTNTPSVTKSLKELENKESNIKKEINQIEEELNKSKKIQSLISEYDIKYPGYKFITRDIMINIMKKYDLVLGDSFMYSREIPDKSLNIISNFSNEIKASEETIYFVNYQHRGGFGHYINLKFENTKPVSDTFTYSNIIKEFKKNKFKMIAPLSHFNIPTYKVEGDWNSVDQTLSLFKLNISTRMLEPDHNTLFQYNQKVKEVLDPIACLEVEGGYIIMDAWDKEADIPEIKNLNLN